MSVAQIRGCVYAFEEPQKENHKAPFFHVPAYICVIGRQVLVLTEGFCCMLMLPEIDIPKGMTLASRAMETHKNEHNWSAMLFRPDQPVSRNQT